MGGTGAGKQRQPYAPYPPMQQNPMSSLAGNFNQMMQDLQSLGTMSQLAQQLSMVQGKCNTTSSLQSIQPAQQPTNQQDTVDALTKLLHSTSHSPVKPASLEDTQPSPDVKKLQQDVDRLSQKVDKQAADPAAVQTDVKAATGAAESCLQESRATRDMMAQLMTKFDKSAASSSCAPSSLPVSEGADGEHPKPLCPVVDTIPEHEKLCSALGVGVRSTTKIVGIREKIGDGLSFKDWWQEIGKTKTAPQWANKLKNCGVLGDMCVDMNLEAAGQILFQHIDDESSFGKSVIQECLA